MLYSGLRSRGYYCNVCIYSLRLLAPNYFCPLRSCVWEGALLTSPTFQFWMIIFPQSHVPEQPALSPKQSEKPDGDISALSRCEWRREYLLVVKESFRTTSACRQAALDEPEHCLPLLPPLQINSPLRRVLLLLPQLLRKSIWTCDEISLVTSPLLLCLTGIGFNPLHTGRHYLSSA